MDLDDILAYSRKLKRAVLGSADYISKFIYVREGVDGIFVRTSKRKLTRTLYITYYFVKPLPASPCLPTVSGIAPCCLMRLTLAFLLQRQRLAV